MESNPTSDRKKIPGGSLDQDGLMAREVLSLLLLSPTLQKALMLGKGVGDSSLTHPFPGSLLGAWPTVPPYKSALTSRLSLPPSPS